MESGSNLNSNTGDTTQLNDRCNPIIIAGVTDLKSSGDQSLNFSMESSEITLPAESMEHQQQGEVDLSPQSKYKIEMKPGQCIRNYQHELAKPGIDGKNYIIVAPTSSGKTLVAALFIAQHLQTYSGQDEQPKVAFVVKTRPLAEQQTTRLQAEFIPSARVLCCMGTAGDPNTEGSSKQIYIKDELYHHDIIVCAAGKFLEELK